MIGTLFAAASAVTGAIGGFYAAKNQQNQLNSQALSLDFQSSLSQINARAAEFDAQQELLAGERAIGAQTMAAGNARGSAQAALGARGVQAGVGNAAEILASMDFVKELDTLTISANATRASEANRIKAMNERNQADLLKVSASNMRRSARTIKPWMSAATSLLGGAGQIASQWSYTGSTGGGGERFVNQRGAS